MDTKKMSEAEQKLRETIAHVVQIADEGGIVGKLEMWPSDIIDIISELDRLREFLRMARDADSSETDGEGARMLTAAIAIYDSKTRATGGEGT